MEAALASANFFSFVAFFAYRACLAAVIFARLAFFASATF